MTHNLADYEALALRLASDPARSAPCATKLEHNRLTYPLFDTERFRRHIEAAYCACGRISGAASPRSFRVDPPNG